MMSLQSDKPNELAYDSDRVPRTFSKTCSIMYRPLASNVCPLLGSIFKDRSTRINASSYFPDLRRMYPLLLIVSTSFGIQYRGIRGIYFQSFIQILYCIFIFFQFVKSESFVNNGRNIFCINLQSLVNIHTIASSYFSKLKRTAPLLFNAAII